MILMGVRGVPQEASAALSYSSMNPGVDRRMWFPTIARSTAPTQNILMLPCIVSEAVFFFTDFMDKKD